MSSTSLARSVGDIDSFILMLRAACDDRVMNARLERLLSLPDERRRAIVHTWIGDMVIAKAPRPLIEAVACLSDDRVAEKAYEVIFPCKSLLAAADAPRGQWRAKAWMTAVMLGGLLFGMQLAADIVQVQQAGLASPAGAAQLWQIAPGVLGLAAALGTAAWLHAGWPARRLAWAAATIALAAALIAILFLHLAIAAPVVG